LILIYITVFTVIKKISAFVLGFIHLNWALVGEVTVAVISG
jgi:hypothetical protein